MNTRLLRQIQKAVLAEPRRLDMAYFGKVGTIHTHDTDPKNIPPCNTQGCVAGHALWITHPRVFMRLAALKTDDGQISLRATADLRLTPEQAARLFYFKDWEIVRDANGDYLGWPKKFTTRYEKARTAKGRANAVVSRIDHFINTEGRE